PSKNSLTTGTLHAGDLGNRETWDASQTSIGGGIGGIKAGKPRSRAPRRCRGCRSRASAR
ncbi:hypothetical protein, partial [Sphingomonas pituitosa]|uniref:hypothetical protein n=1 Tax=Sphingomonas pituitosa TaxID=99597 RepID=UPI001C3FCF01